MSGDDLRTILRCFRAPWHDLIQADVSGRTPADRWGTLSAHPTTHQTVCGWSPHRPCAV